MDAPWDYLPPTFHLFDGGLLPRWGSECHNTRKQGLIITPLKTTMTLENAPFFNRKYIPTLSWRIFQPVILVNSGVFGHIQGSWVVNNPLDSHDVSPSDSHICWISQFPHLIGTFGLLQLVPFLTGKQPNPNQKMVIEAGSLKHIYIYVCVRSI